MRLIPRPLYAPAIMVLILLVAAGSPRAAALGTWLKVKLNDGTSLVGRLMEDGDESIVIRTRNGLTVSVPRENIRSMTPMEPGQFERSDPNVTRLFFAPTARPLGHQNGYVSFYEIFAPFVAVGVGDVVTLAGGVTINPGTSRLLYGAAKVTFWNKDNFSLAAGGLGMQIVGDSDEDPAALLFGVATMGSPRSALSLGLAYGYASGELTDRPGFMIGGEHQVSNSVKLLTENYVFPAEDGLVVSGGIRFFGDRLAADIGLITAPLVLDEADGFPFVPWLGFAYNFQGPE